MTRALPSAALGVLLGGAVAAAGMPTPAQAQEPGDASAQGVIVDLGAEVAGVELIGANVTVGDVDAPPDEGTNSEELLDIAIDELGVTATGTVGEVVATRGADASMANSDIANLSLALLGNDVLNAGAISASVECPAVGEQIADTIITDLSLFGDPVTLEPNVPVESSLGVTIPGTLDASLDVTLTRIEQTNVDGAAAAAVVADVQISATLLDGTPVVVSVGSVTLAQASCERPLQEAPTAESIDPASGPETGGTEVTITGSGFVPGETTVTFDGVEATDVVVAEDGMSLTAVTPPGEPGTVPVVVSTPAGDTDPLDFTYLEVIEPPTADEVDPAEGPTTGGTEVTITGSGFVPGETTVTFDGVEATDVVVAEDGMSLTAVTPPGEPGTVPVVVSTPAGDTDPLDFTYLLEEEPQEPVIDDLEPEEGPSDGGTTVTVTGSGFVSGETTVTICDTTLSADEVTVSEDGTMLTFETPACDEGATLVTVTTPVGTSNALTFLYVDDALPVTGSPTSTLLAAGSGLALAGTALVSAPWWGRLRRLFA